MKINRVIKFAGKKKRPAILKPRNQKASSFSQSIDQVDLPKFYITQLGSNKRAFCYNACRCFKTYYDEGYNACLEEIINKNPDLHIRR